MNTKLGDTTFMDSIRYKGLFYKARAYVRWSMRTNEMPKDLPVKGEVDNMQVLQKYVELANAKDSRLEKKLQGLH